MALRLPAIAHRPWQNPKRKQRRALAPIARWQFLLRGREAALSRGVATREQIQDLESRLAAERDTATAENVDEKKSETARLTDEFTKRIVDESERVE